MESLTSILASTFKIDENSASKDLRMEDVISWDSLTHMDLIVAIESKYDIVLSGDDIAQMLSFSEIREIVKRYVG